MAEDTLFELPDPQPSKPEGPTSPQQARVLRPVRNQMEWVARDLDSSLPEDHPARAIWAFLERLDLSPFYACIKSVMGRAGHPTTDPQVLLALWLFVLNSKIQHGPELRREGDESPPESLMDAASALHAEGHSLAETEPERGDG